MSHRSARTSRCVVSEYAVMRSTAASQNEEPVPAALAMRAPLSEILPLRSPSANSGQDDTKERHSSVNLHPRVKRSPVSS